MRSFIVGNALMWLRDYHFDGLRLDAVHALQDHRAVHILEELAVAVDGLGAATGRSLVLVAESDMNNPRLITPREAGGYGLSAQWDDDFHHTVHALVTGERQGYYGDFGAIAGRGQGAGRGLLPRRHVVVIPEPDSRVPRGHSAYPRLPVRRLRPRPRPGRQPGRGRPPACHARRAPAPGRAAAR